MMVAESTSSDFKSAPRSRRLAKIRRRRKRSHRENRACQEIIRTIKYYRYKFVT